MGGLDISTSEYYGLFNTLIKHIVILDVGS